MPRWRGDAGGGTDLLTGTIRYNRDRWQYEERLLIKTADELNDLDPAGALPVAFVGQAELSPELQDRLVIPAANPAYKAAYLIYTVLGGPLGTWTGTRTRRQWSSTGRRMPLAAKNR